MGVQEVSPLIRIPIRVWGVTRGAMARNGVADEAEAAAGKADGGCGGHDGCGDCRRRWRWQACGVWRIAWWRYRSSRGDGAWRGGKLAIVVQVSCVGVSKSGKCCGRYHGGSEGEWWLATALALISKVTALYGGDGERLKKSWRWRWARAWKEEHGRDEWWLTQVLFCKVLNKEVYAWWSLVYEEQQKW